MLNRARGNAGQFLYKNSSCSKKASFPLFQVQLSLALSTVSECHPVLKGSRLPETVHQAECGADRCFLLSLCKANERKISRNADAVSNDQAVCMRFSQGDRISHQRKPYTGLDEIQHGSFLIDERNLWGLDITSSECFGEQSVVHGFGRRPDPGELSEFAPIFPQYALFPAFGCEHAVAKAGERERMTALVWLSKVVADIEIPCTYLLLNPSRHAVLQPR